MERLKVIPFILYVLSSLACLATDTGEDISNQTRKSPTSSPIPSKTKQESKNRPAFDILALANKTKNEVEKILGMPVRTDKLNESDSSGELSWEYGDQSLKWKDFRAFINFKNGKANYFHYENKEGFEDPIQLANEVELDLTLSEAAISNSALHEWNDLTLDGIRYSQIRLVKSGNGLFKIATVRVR